METGFCGGFVAQWFMAALVRHPGFESRSCQFFAFLLSLSAGWIPINVRNIMITKFFLVHLINPFSLCLIVSYGLDMDGWLSWKIHNQCLNLIIS